MEYYFKLKKLLILRRKIKQNIKSLLWSFIFFYSTHIACNQLSEMPPRDTSIKNAEEQIFDSKWAWAALPAAIKATFDHSRLLFRLSKASTSQRDAAK